MLTFTGSQPHTASFAEEAANLLKYSNLVTGIGESGVDLFM